MNKYEKLTVDIEAAIKAAEPMRNTEDGGTCNFDSPTLSLPRWNEAKTMAAIGAAGARAFTWSCYGSKKFVLCVRSGGQGNRRTRFAEAVKDALKAAGYDAGMYYQMD